MLLPGKELWDQLLTPTEQVRIKELDNPERTPCLIIRTSSLTLKYLLSRKSFRVFSDAIGPNGEVIIGVQIPDDDQHPAQLWSIVESENELRALKLLFLGNQTEVHLYNETMTNVASATVIFDHVKKSLPDYWKASELKTKDFHNQHEDIIDNYFDHSMSDSYWIKNSAPVEWRELRTHYITSKMTSEIINIFNQDEGKQQEKVGMVLADGLHLSTVYNSPQIPKGINETRELIDILMHSECGFVLIESKTLSIFDKTHALPSRSQLLKSLLKNIEKGLMQLPGALKKVRNNTPIITLSKEEIIFERDHNCHCIILVPDLSLLHDQIQLGGQFLNEFLIQHKAYLHFLDLSEMFQLVQQGLILAETKSGITPVVGFTYYLVKRFEFALKTPTPSLTTILIN